MIYLDEKKSNLSFLIENQFPDFVQENNERFIEFISSYYESQELKYKPLDIVSNLTDYYNISYFNPAKLTESTLLTQDLDSTSTATISVENTDGFPDTNGYIKINDEIIFYRTKTDTTFNDCERGTKSLILENELKSNIYLRDSVSAEHRKNSSVVNIAFYYANEFFQRIKGELAPSLPEILDESLDVGGFIRNIRTFYSSKGSLNSHRILFRILFNDRKFNIIFKNRGFGAKLKINNTRGKVDPDPKPEIVSGGVNYDDRKEGGVLINPPLVIVSGSGVGVVGPNGTRPNSTAVIEVTDIDSNGVITDINVTDTGENYRGPITAKVRPRNFLQEQIVYNTTGTGTGRVEYFDPFTNELVLYDVIGYFSPNDEILTDSGEKARGFIAKSFSTPVASRNGFEVIGEDQEIEFPKNYTFSTSSSKSTRKKVSRFKLIDGYELVNGFLPKVVSFVQDPDPRFGVKGSEIEVDNSYSVGENIYEFDISLERDIENVYLQPSTNIIKNESITGNSSGFIVSVDDASRFPIRNGIIYVNGKEIFYKSRSIKQFFDCEYNGSENFLISAGDEVISFGRLITLNSWKQGESISINDYRYYGNNLYKAKNSGVSGTQAPTWTEGSQYDGTIINSNPVEWVFVGKNRFDHSFYIDYKDPDVQNPKFRLLALPGNVIITDGGSLHADFKYEFSGINDKNINSYNFDDPETSDLLSTIFGKNDSNYITDTRFLRSYNNITGIQNQYDFGPHIYIASSGLPPWWNSITTNTGTLFSSLDKSPLNDDAKKVAFTNQKIVSRIKKSALFSSRTNIISDGRKNKKLVGISTDGIQINSYRGNTVEYGKLSKFLIADGGNYPVPYTLSGNSYGVWYAGLPKLKVNGVTLSGSGYIRIASSFKKINFAQLFSEYESELTGFTSKPEIQVLNDNPSVRKVFTLTVSSSIDIVDKTITLPESHELETGDILTFRYLNNKNYFKSLINDTVYFVKKIDDVTVKLYKTKSEAFIGTSPVSLDYITSFSSSTFTLSTDTRNHPDFQPAVLDVSYKDGSIDNIVIINSGFGYVELPSIVISGGGKETTFKVPYAKDGVRFIECEGPLVSSKNYYKETFNEIEVTSINTIFENRPDVEVFYGGGAEAIAYVSDGSISSLIISERGSGYTIPPRVVIGFGGNQDAFVISKLDSSDTLGEVKELEITSEGTGYFSSPRITIESVETKKALITAKLKEWTFNIQRQLKSLGRLDDYGGYVYDAADSVPTSGNSKNLQMINYSLDFPSDEDTSQYYLLHLSDKLLARTIYKNNSSVNQLEPDDTNITSILNYNYHSPIVAFSYDGIPIYGGNKIYSDRRLSTSSLIKAKSRWKLKYSTVSSGTSGAISIPTQSGVEYVKLTRDGGPSISQYPIGSFIEDFEFVSGDIDDLDYHNGRYCVTPEFPAGRYCYFATTESYDEITNELLKLSAAGNSGVGVSGFPYFVGDTFASEYDEYANNRCRTNDKIPKGFNRTFEGSIYASDDINFGGIDANPYYPSEDTRISSTISSTNSITSGSVESVIIENPGDLYRVGDKIEVDNSLSSGGGFSAFVSKVLGKNIVDISKVNDTVVEFKTNVHHELSVGDYVYFDYKQVNDPIDVYLIDAVAGTQESNLITDVDDLVIPNVNFQGKELKRLVLNFKYSYKIYIPVSNFDLSFDIEKENQFFNIDEIQTNYIILDASKIPSTLFLDVNNIIYIITKTTDYYGPARIEATKDLYTFSIRFKESTNNYLEDNLFYSAKSFGARGPIRDVVVSNTGQGYKKLPIVTGIVKKGSETDIAGNGKAIVQLYSSSIGKIKDIGYSSIASSFTSNLNVNHQLKLPSTAKIINNFEIYEVEVLSGGDNYDNVVELLVNGKDNISKLKATVSVGTITSVEVIDGGSNLSEIPTITVVSQYGSGAKFSAKIRRKNLFSGSLLKTNRKSKKFPVPIEGTVLGFDYLTSTLQFTEDSGYFENGDEILTYDGSVYGKIVKISRPSAYSKVSTFTSLNRRFDGINGNTSESLQKITDSNYYQDWSYTIKSSRDTIEWKKQQLDNTHPAGFKSFGKKTIERRKQFFDDPSEVFKSSVIFTSNISNKIDLNVKLSPCSQRRLLVQDTTLYSPGDYIFGIFSGAIGQVLFITEYFIFVELRNKNDFKLNEIIVKITPDFALRSYSATKLSLSFYEGILQEPVESYDVAAAKDSSEYYFVPSYDVDKDDNIVLYKFDPRYDTADPPNIINNFDVLDSQYLDSTDDTVSFTKDSVSYNVSTSTLEQFIISIGGIVQNPNNLTVSNNTIQLGSQVGFDDTKVIALRHSNLRKLSFTGSGTTYTLNYTPSTNCELLIFYVGVFQTHLIPSTDYTITNNIIEFESSVNSSEIFGWYIQNETVLCETIDTELLDKNRVLSVIDCTSSNPKKLLIETNGVKNPESLYELRSELIDGTIYPASNTRVEGFDTRFTYTSPRYSSSYVEVLDKIEFNNSTKTFKLTRDGVNYSPSNGEESLVVYIDNDVLDHDLYSVSGTNITFTNTYPSSKKCTIIDYVSKFLSNTNNDNGAILDRLEVQQNGTRKTFNLSDRGVPKYVNNVSDIYVLKDRLLKIPTSSFLYHNNTTLSTQSVNDNKITFTDAPLASEDIELAFFNRQLLPEPTKNVILDRFRCFDGIRTEFPITVDGILYTPSLINHLFMVRNGVMQIPGVDYTISGSTLTFTTAPESYETVFSFYSYDGLNQNLKFDTFKKFDGVQKDFALTYNYVSSYLDRDSDIMVYRNGVYQYPGTYTVLNKQSGPYIRFNTAPLESESDKIFIVNYNPTNNDDLVDITDRFSQINSTTLGYTPTTPTIDNDVILIYLGGTLQTEGNFIFDTVANTLTLSYPVTLGTDDFKVFAFVSKKKILDSFTVQSLDTFKKYDGTTTKFALTKDYKEVTVHDTHSIQVIQNGLYLHPTTDYVVGTSTNNPLLVGPNDSRYIDFVTAPSVGDNIIITNIVNNITTNITSEFTQISPTVIQFSNAVTIDKTVFLIYVDGLLKSSEDWTYNSINDRITFNSPVSLTTDNVTILAFTTPGKLLDSFDIIQIDDFKNFNSSNTNFPLTYNYINNEVISEENIHVFRNGVYQYPNVDYALYGGVDDAYINFSTAPDSTENVFILNHKNTDIADVTFSFSGTGSTSTLTYTPVPGIDTDLFLIYVNGIPQVNWSFNSNTSILTLGDVVDLSVDKIKIFAFNSQKEILDTFVIDSNSSYVLTNLALPVSVSSATDLVVVIDGVYQQPGVSYTASGSTITLLNSSQNIGSTVYVYKLGYNYDMIVLDNIDDNYTKTTFKLSYNFKHYTIYGSEYLLIYKNGVKLEPFTDFIAQTGVVIFQNPVLETDSIIIKIKKYKLKVNGNIITSDFPSSNEEVTVSLNGYVQQPGLVYTIGNSDEITINDNYVNVGSRYHMFQLGGDVQTLDYIDDNFNKNSFKLLSNYVYYDVSDSGTIFVFKNGILLENITDYTYSDGYINFVQPITDQDKILIGVDSYNLMKGSVTLSTDLPNVNEDILVHINGVVQEPEESYLISGSTITLQKTHEMVTYDKLSEIYLTDTAFLYQVGGNANDVQKMDYIDDNYSKSTYKLSIGYQSFNPPNVDDILIIRNGVVQNPSEDFIVGNGYITFSTNVNESEQLFIMYTHGTEELTINSVQQISPEITRFNLSSYIDPSEYENIIFYADGTPRMYSREDFTFGGSTYIDLNHSTNSPPTSAFIVKYPSVTTIDEYDDCPNGERRRFKLLLNDQNLVINNIVSDADILLSRNGKTLKPGSDYVLSANRGFVYTSEAPDYNDEFFMVRMSANESINLISTSTSGRYDLTQTIPSSERENVVLFLLGKWYFQELGDFYFVDGNTIQINSSLVTSTNSQISSLTSFTTVNSDGSTTTTSGSVILPDVAFCMKFFGVFNLLDQINTPFNGQITRFNLFDLEENFVPVGTVDDDSTPHPTSLLVVKNGKILEPSYDYDIEPVTDNETQIVFTVAPVLGDVISIRTVGSFDKLDTITNGSGTTFEILKSGSKYYANSHIERPRKLENQLLVVKDGDVQSPLYDYYIDNEKIRFTSSKSFTRLFIMDFRGTYDDVKVNNRFNQVSKGDKIFIAGEDTEREVTQVLSPTLLTTSSYNGTTPSGFASTVSYSGGKVTDIVITNKGKDYSSPVIIRTKGTGSGARAYANTKLIYGDQINDSTLELQYPGHNIYTQPVALATMYASVYKSQPLNKSNIRKATKLLENINNSTESFTISNGFGLPSNPPVVYVNSSSGSGAEFKLYVSGGEIRKIDILNGGSGYDDRDFVIGVTGGSGDGCVLEGVLNNTGTITDVIIRNPGVGYDTFRVFFYKEVSGVVKAEGVEYTYVKESPISTVGFNTTNSDGIYQFGNGTAIVSGGTGTGSTGGFDIGTHLRFGDNSGTRFVTFDPIDTRGINTVRVYAIRGNGSNGGETPDVVGDEDLRIQYQSTAPGVAPDSNSWVDLGIVIDAVPNGTGTGVLDNYDFSLPSAVQDEHVYFRLIQDTNSGADYDHYGILNISFLGYPTYTLDGCTRGAVGTAISHTTSELVYFDSYL